MKPVYHKWIRTSTAYQCINDTPKLISHFLVTYQYITAENFALQTEDTDLTWFHFHTVGTVYLNSGKSFSGKRGQWRKGQRRKYEGLEDWRKNYSPCTCAALMEECWVQKIQQICLNLYFGKIFIYYEKAYTQVLAISLIFPLKAKGWIFYGKKKDHAVFYLKDDLAHAFKYWSPFLWSISNRACI